MLITKRVIDCLIQRLRTIIHYERISLNGLYQDDNSAIENNSI